MRAIKKEINWGILGTGTIANKFAVGASAVPDARLLAVGSRTRQSAETFAASHCILRAYPSYEELLCDPEIDAVYIATPHSLHFENMLQCIVHKKHILCEKPFTVNKKQAGRVFELAGAENLFVMEAMWSRFIPGMQQVLDMINAGVIGDVRMLKADFGFFGPTDPSGRLHNPELAGGALLDVGIYPLALAFWVLGDRPERVMSVPEIGETGVDKQNSILLRYPGGAMAQLASSIKTKLANSAVILGDKGKVLLDRFWCVEHIVWEVYNGSVYSQYIPILKNGYEYEIIEANRCIREGSTESPLHSKRATLCLIDTMDAIREDWGLRYPFE